MRRSAWTPSTSPSSRRCRSSGRSSSRPCRPVRPRGSPPWRPCVAPETAPLLVAEGLAKGFGSGEARVEVFRGVSLRVLAGAPRAAVRGAGVGFVFQFHHLLPELTAEENVALPLFLAGRPEEEGRRA